MAAVTLLEAYLHDIVDLSDYVTTDGFGGLTEEDNAAGSVRYYANGRARSVTAASRPWSATLVFPAADRAVVDWLRDHKGTVVMYRDPFGRIEWGAYYALRVTEPGRGADPTASLVLTRVTASAEV